jgi:hypothetical protein
MKLRAYKESSYVLDFMQTIKILFKAIVLYMRREMGRPIDINIFYLKTVLTHLLAMT